jgi:ribosomal protein S18 acetylase RimI-like enzyme
MIKEIDSSQLCEVNKIILCQLGSDCLIKDVQQTETKRMFVAMENGIVTGVAVVEIINDVDNKLMQQFKEFLTFPFGFLSRIAVDPLYCGRGIATKLVETSCDWLNCKVSSVYGTAWISSRGINIKVPLERNGFFSIKQFDNYYKDCINCPECTPYNCKCKMMLFKLCFHQ